LQISDAVIFLLSGQLILRLNIILLILEKFSLIPFASNLSAIPSLQEIHDIVNNRNDNILKLLFLGVDWERKGGGHGGKCC